ncbi:glycosyltransferase family 2 protein [Cyanobium sp. Aljojuca 7D2]|uniref:glycosyltransferase family 2 protein n=1 Tax=Cyanobium sp. Aljojuca 7D2 TaxID=2823698 RepID=UPI0020CD5F57|nr:glycosyltransferase family 2 protein [Cyanobium sp. Aljojuca 7D2]MCP9890035.1 glycosyltransferase family 2 protein [Cyanobium sp. Aljojuca 7D2]
MTAQPSISLIISTYNSASWLAKVLESVFAQSCADFEVVIADDGSRPDTAELLQAYAARSPVRIVHVWQQDQGFQKCRILNKAIAVSKGNRLLFTDGDCVLPPGFVASHKEMARPGHFLTGAYFKLPASLSDLVTAEDIQNADVFGISWLLSHGLTPSTKLLKLILPRPLTRIANHLTPTKKTWNGHNSSCLRSEAMMVNGFNEDIQYGGQDVEFGTRLNHAGIRGRHLRFSSIPLHLYHDHSYVTPGMRERSMNQRLETIRQRRVRALRGLDQWLNSDGIVHLDPSDRCQVLK